MGGSCRRFDAVGKGSVNERVAAQLVAHSMNAYMSLAIFTVKESPRVIFNLLKSNPEGQSLLSPDLSHFPEYIQPESPINQMNF